MRPSGISYWGDVDVSDRIARAGDAGRLGRPRRRRRDDAARRQSAALEQTDAGPRHHAGRRAGALGAVDDARQQSLMVRLTRIYTRGGDKGETSLGDGSRVPKQALRVEAFGTVDEANAAIGLARLHVGAPADADTDAMPARVHTELFELEIGRAQG